MKGKKIAIVDIGTYSTRMLIVAIHPDNFFQEIFSIGRITSLGRNLKQTGMLQKDAMEETISTLREYSMLAREYQVSKIVAVATQACREAKNADEFLEKVKHLGIDVRVISGEEEARLSFFATARALEIQDRFVVIDQGGGSTEFAYGKSPNLIKGVSFPFGIVNLTENFIRSDPPAREEILSLKEYIKEQISKVYPIMKDNSQLVGLGGTITTVVALEKQLFPYNSKKVHGSVLTYDTITKWLNRLSSMTVNQRKAIPMIEDRRAEAIISGIVIFQTALEVFKKDLIRVSEWGIRHGILLSLLENRGI
ncbi:MAG: Ppx/GppA family phosphatase [Hydrogenothermaceae bacterium]|nr:Ppx/GppA family phosphatase [Hydrogenothermaceae bacterium]